MNDDTKKKLWIALGCLLLGYFVVTTRLISIGPTDGHNSRLVIGTNFWAFRPIDSAVAYCERNLGTNRRLDPINCADSVSKAVANKWIITLSEAETPESF